MRYTVNIVAGLAVLLLWWQPASAAICFPPEVRPESAFHYYVALADALTRTKGARDRVLAAFREKAGRFSPTDAMIALKTAQQDYQCAASYLAPYRESKNEAIVTSSRGAGDALLVLRDLTGAIVDDIKALLDSTGTGGGEGTRAERDAERTLAVNGAWQALLVSVVAATHAIVEFNPTTKKADRFSLTGKQRKEMIHRLEKSFGPSIRSQRTAAMPLETSVKMLLTYLKDRSWRSYDDT